MKKFLCLILLITGCSSFPSKNTIYQVENEIFYTSHIINKKEECYTVKFQRILSTDKIINLVITNIKCTEQKDRFNRLLIDCNNYSKRNR